MMTKKGFSLLELLIVLFLSSILLSLLFSSFFLTNRSIKVADPLIEDDLSLAILGGRFEEDIQGVFIPAQAELVFTPTTLKPPSEQPKVIDKVFYSINKNNTLDILSFITNNPLITYYDEKSGIPTPAVVRVTYSLRKEAEKTFSLVRHQSSNLEFDTNFHKRGIGYDLANSIKNISMEYRFEKKAASTSPSASSQEARIEIKRETEWRYDEWLKKDPKSSMPRIPQYICMKMTLVTSNGQEQNREFMVELPIFNFLSVPKQRNAPAAPSAVPPVTAPNSPLPQAGVIPPSKPSLAPEVPTVVPVLRTTFVQVPLETLNLTKG